MHYHIGNRYKKYESKDEENIKYESEQLGLLIDDDFVSAYQELIDKKAASTSPFLALDTETNGLDCRINKVLLVGIGDETTQFTIEAHKTELITYCMNYARKKGITFVAHQAAFDYLMMKGTFDVVYDKWYCTMLVEDRLTMNTFQNAGLEASLRRRLKSNYTPYDKSTRLSFVGMSPKTFKPTTEQIKYLADDVKYLLPLKDKQRLFIKKYKLEKALKIEFDIISEITIPEFYGYNYDWEGNLKYMKEQREQREQYAIELDKELNKLIEQLDEKKQRLYFKAQHRTVRSKSNEATLQSNLFGEVQTPEEMYSVTSKGKIKDVSKRFKYNSPQELTLLFAKFEAPLPIDRKKVKAHKFKPDYVVPTLMKTVPKLSGDCYDWFEWDNTLSMEKTTTEEKPLKAMLAAIPEHPMRDFIYAYIKWKKVNTELNNFTMKFPKVKNVVTGRLHTRFNQCKTNNGRFSSGGHDYVINIQQTPRNKQIRNLFLADDGKSFVTRDLSGAEVTIMSSQADDHFLYDIAVKQGDAHSPLAQACWRNVYLHRATVLTPIFKEYHEQYAKAAARKYKVSTKKVTTGHTFMLFKDNINFRKEASKQINFLGNYFDLYKNFVVSKSENYWYRQAQKNGTFGIIYGIHATKLVNTISVTNEKTRETLDNLTIPEAVIMIETEKEILRKTVQYVDAVAEEAINKGMLVLNSRTNTVVFYEDVLNAKKYGEELSFSKRIDIMNNARNIKISGTQADMIKETISNLKYFINYTGVDAQFQMQIHDELVYQCPKEYDGVSDVPQKKLSLKGMDMSFPQAMDYIMEHTCDFYLRPGYNMKVEGEVLPYWTK